MASSPPTFSSLIHDLCQNDASSKSQLLNDLLLTHDNNNSTTTTTSTLITQTLLEVILSNNSEKTTTDQLVETSNLIKQVSHLQDGEGIIRLLLQLSLLNNNKQQPLILQNPKTTSKLLTNAITTSSIIHQHFIYEKNLLLSLHGLPSTNNSNNNHLLTPYTNKILSILTSIQEQQRLILFQSPSQPQSDIRLIITTFLDNFIQDLHTNLIQIAMESTTLIQLQYKLRHTFYSSPNNNYGPILDHFHNFMMMIPYQENNDIVLVDTLFSLSQKNVDFQPFANKLHNQCALYYCHIFYDNLLSITATTTDMNTIIDLPQSLLAVMEDFPIRTLTRWLILATKHTSFVLDHNITPAPVHHHHHHNNNSDDYREYFHSMIINLNQVLVHHLRGYFHHIALNWLNTFFEDDHDRPPPPPRNTAKNYGNEVIPSSIIQCFTQTSILLHRIKSSLRYCFEKPHHMAKHEMMHFIRLLQQRLCDFITFDVWPELLHSISTNNNKTPDDFIDYFHHAHQRLYSYLFASPILTRLVDEILDFPLAWINAVGSTNNTMSRDRILQNFRERRNFIISIVTANYID
jgi:hypothetical protein